MISIRPRQVNIMEGYYDGSRVNVRYRKPIPMPPRHHHQQKNAELVLRWSQASPIGETKSFDALNKVKSSSEQCVTSQALIEETKHRRSPGKQTVVPDRTVHSTSSDTRRRYEPESTPPKRSEKKHRLFPSRG